MPRRRFEAPAHAQVDPARWAMPIFDAYRCHSERYAGNDWPTLASLDAALAAPLHPVSGVPLHFIEQTPALLEDGLHYEQRIFTRGQIATRSENWHDLFNALVWIEHRALKAALNARQVSDLARVGITQRTPGQCALTQFDEAGAIVLLRDPSLLALWDAHDWHGLFWRERTAWSDGRLQLLVFGHALLEHALNPQPLLVGKCLVLNSAGIVDTTTAAARIAQAVTAGQVLRDPQELRPLPLAGLPGWHPDAGRENFYFEAPCFRPARPGRQYPEPVRWKTECSIP